jgi:rifampicin phosphotransferase
MRSMMDANAEVFDLAQAAAADREKVGGKARVLGELAIAGFSVPPGLVVTAAAVDIDGWERSLEAAARRLGVQRFAVRSSGAAEDLPDASYAGLYETYLNVPVEGLGEAVRRCFAAISSERVSVYHQRHVAARPGWRSWCRRW